MKTKEGKSKQKIPYTLAVNFSTIYERKKEKIYINLFQVMAESFVSRCCCASLKDRKVGLASLLARTPQNYEVNSETWESS